MRETHERLYAARLSPEHRAMTCGYYYTVTKAHGGAHTAFVTRAGLDRWLSERGLSLAGPLDAEGLCCAVLGTYRTEMHLSDADQFPDLKGVLTRAMSNGDWVEGVITTDSDGVRTVHTLNPNVRGRKVYDYRESEALMT